MSWQDMFQQSLFQDNELSRKDRIIIYLITKTNDYGLITTTIKKISKATHIPYTSTQILLQELIDKGHIVRLHSGLYAPILHITDMPEEKVNRIISSSKIDNYIFLRYTKKNYPNKKEKVLCPKEVMYYLRKNK